MFRILSPAFAAHQTKTFQAPRRHIVDTDLILAFTCLVVVDQRRDPQNEEWNKQMEPLTRPRIIRQGGKSIEPIWLALPSEACLFSQDPVRPALGYKMRILIRQNAGRHAQARGR